MKKHYKHFLLIAILTMPIGLVSCAGNKVNLEEQNVDVYELGTLGLIKRGKTHYYKINNSSIPYKNINDFVSEYMVRGLGDQMASFKVETKSNQSIITNLSSNGTAIIDYDKQTISYSDLTAYFNETNRSDIPIGCDFGWDDYFVGLPTSVRTEHKECVVSLNDYHMHAYLIDGIGYLPETFMFHALVPMANQGVVFNGQDCYLVDGLPGASEEFENGVKHIRETATIFNKEFMEYNYDTTAFLMDFRFGLTGKTHINRNPSAYELSHTYFKDGAYATLEQYKNDLCSTELDVSNNTILKVLLDELGDGGHSSYLCHDIFSTLEGSNAALASMMFCLGGAHEMIEYENFYLTMVVGLGLFGKRSDTKADPAIMTGNENAKAGFKIYSNESNSGQVAYMVFDSFEMPNNPDVRVKSEDINENNYYNDTMSLVHWANRQLKANPYVKDLVIDLSCNGGGDAAAEEFISSWLCGGTSKLDIYNRQDGSIRTLERHADVNLDGKLDAQDYLSEDYNVYCIFSNASFSCGNLLPCDLKDHALPAIHLLGTKTGGGSCSVEPNHFNAIGGHLILSSLYTLCRESSTVDNVVTVEDGVTGDFEKYPFSVGDEINNPEKFFAVDNIINAILS